MSRVAVRVYIIRHGETAENRLGIMQGQIDTNLNDEGMKQAQLAATALEHVPLRKVFSSDLNRAVKTAEAILEKHPDVHLEKQEGLRERHLGDWQGQRIATRGAVAPDNAESLIDFSLRATRWWTTSIAEYAASLKADGANGEQTEPTCVLAVSHGGFISRLISNLVQDGWIKCADGVAVNTKYWNASISVIDVHDDGKGVLVTYSDTTHLKKTDLVDTSADVITER